MFFIYGFWLYALWVFYNARCSLLYVDANENTLFDATLRRYGNDMAMDDDPLRFISVVSSFMGLVRTAEKISISCLRQRSS